MLEAKLEQGALLKKLIEAVKELVTDANWDCNESGIALQGIVVRRLKKMRGGSLLSCDL
jgi:hypothetical protein